MVEATDKTTATYVMEDEDVVEGRSTMLIVEDNVGLMAYLKQHFSAKFEVVTAVNGAIGLNKAMALLPDIIISDLIMPEMMGDQMCEQIKSAPESSHIPIVILTAKASSKDRVKGYEYGADMYCAKPFDIDELDAIVESMLANRAKMQKRYRSSLDTRVDDMVVNDMDETLINRAIVYIEQNMRNGDLKLSDVADQVGLSNYLLNKKLKSVVGMSGNCFIRSIRLKYAAKMLVKGNSNVSQATYAAGFNNLKYFRECFVEMFGMSPSEYKRLNTDK